jgi:DNA-binding NarL/FixJ family response regulator
MKSGRPRSAAARRVCAGNTHRRGDVLRSKTSASSPTIRVLISAEVRLYSEGIALLLDREADIEVAATTTTREQTVAGVAALRPVLVLIDSAMPGAVASIREMRRQEADVKIVVLGLPDADPAIIECAEAGVSGFLTRDASRAELVATVRGAARGEALCSPRVVARLLHRVATLAAERPRSYSGTLTVREAEIVELIDEGLSNKEIAGRLHIEVPTVKSHVHSILEKLGARRRGEAAALMRAAHRTI